MADADLLSAIFDAVPTPMFLVDDDVRILLANRAGSDLLGRALDGVLLERAGEALHCLHSSASPGGCGQSPACRDCVVRRAVGEAHAGGAVRRRPARMTLLHGGAPEERSFLVSASPIALGGEHLAVLTLDDVTAFVQLAPILHACAGCGRIRGDDGAWTTVGAFLKEAADVDLSHGLCEACEGSALDRGGAPGAR